MAFEIQWQWNPYVNQSGVNNTFNFSDVITAFMVGISSFYFKYSDGVHDHSIEEIFVSVTAGNAEGNSLPVRVSGTIMDDDGNSSDWNSDEYARVVNLVAVAWTGDDPNLTDYALTNVNNFDSGKDQSVTVPTNGPYINQAVLNGFDLAYKAGEDHFVASLGASVSAQTPGQGSVITINSTSNMSDTSGNSAQTKTLSAGYIYTSNEFDYNIVAKMITTQTWGTLTVDFSDQLIDTKRNKKYKLSYVYSILAGFALSFSDNDDHQIWRIGAGAGNNPWTVSGDGQSASTTSAYAQMEDGRGNHQDDKNSHVLLVVLGLIEEAS